MTGERTPLLRPEWRYVEKEALDDFRAADWTLLNSQRAPYYAEQQATQALRLLAASAGDPGFGYQVNNFRHCIQSATLAMQDGRDEEYVVMALLHDVGFTTCPTAHGPFAARLLGPYVSERNLWLLEHHQVFMNFHAHELPGCDRDARERYRGHPHFDATAEFVERFDQNCEDPDYECPPLAFFEPMVRRIFARPPRPLALLD
jgi:predicted HD phosphohydrolase